MIEAGLPGKCQDLQTCGWGRSNGSRASIAAGACEYDSRIAHTSIDAGASVNPGPRVVFLRRELRRVFCSSWRDEELGPFSSLRSINGPPSRIGGCTARRGQHESVLRARLPTAARHRLSQPAPLAKKRLRAGPRRGPVGRSYFRFRFQGRPVGASDIPKPVSLPGRWPGLA